MGMVISEGFPWVGWVEEVRNPTLWGFELNKLGD
jgi:hypothetical protein